MQQGVLSGLVEDYQNSQNFPVVFVEKCRYNVYVNRSNQTIGGIICVNIESPTTQKKL